MEIARPSLRRALVALLGTLGALAAWTALSFFLGGTSAQAAERPMDLLGDLDKVVSTTASVVTDTVDGVVAPVASAATESVVLPVTQVAQPMVEAVAPVPGAGPVASAVVSETVDATTATAEAVIPPVAQTLDDEPVAHTTRSVLDALERLPIAGSIVGGLSPALASAAHGVDTVFGSLGGLARTAVDPITSIDMDHDTQGPGQPPADGGTDPGDIAPAPSSERAEKVPKGAVASVPHDGWFWHGAWFASGAASGPPLGATLGSGDPPGSPPTPFSTHSSSSTTAGSGGGAGSGAACIADTAPQSPRAWGFAGGAHDDALPSSPVFDTDTSPD